MFLGNAIASEELVISDKSEELFAIGSKINLLNKSEQYNNAVKDLIESEITVQMKEYIQHGHTTCYQHCINVSYYSYIISKFLHLDAVSSARAGLLHDLFLYDWHELQEKVPLFEMHGFTHPQKALDNANQYFELNEKEEDMILKHMWPLTMKLPKYRESFIVIAVDKICCIAEFLKERKWFKLLFSLSYNQNDFMKNNKE